MDDKGLIRSKGTLILLPTPIAAEADDAAFAGFDPAIIHPVRYFIVEEIRSARRFLRKIIPGFPIDESHFDLLNEHTPETEYQGMLLPLLEGHNVVLMSEAGMPCIADPGWQVVALAHQSGIRVKPLPGPSSIMQALMASGFTGQQFVFHGYLPVMPDQRAKALIQLEKDATLRGFTQIFIETPYRNQQMLNTMLRILRAETLICVATGLMTDDESITVQTVAKWRSSHLTLPKAPAVFLVYHA